MDIGSILKKVGGSLLKNAFPPLSGAAFDLINDALPDDKKLSKDATGNDAIIAIGALEPDQRASLMEKELDVEIEEIRSHTETTKALAEVDKTGHTTRPHIALAFAWNIIIISDLIIISILYAVYKNQITLENCWPLVLAILSPFVVVVRNYFGNRTKEKQQKYQAVTNTPPIAGAISQIIGMFKK